LRANTVSLSTGKSRPVTTSTSVDVGVSATTTREESAVKSM